MKIPLVKPDIGEEEIARVTDAMRSGWISSAGPLVPEFEENFARYCDVDHGVSAMNGTAALHLALAALRIGPGDEVLVPDLTFAATAEAVMHTGATPIAVDIDPSTWTMDPADADRRVTRRTKAMIPVHLYGHPCDMRALQEVAQRHGLRIVEDAAEAHGARHRGERVGGLGDIGVFSFYGNKLLSTGEGGMCVTRDAGLAERMAYLRSHAQPKGRRYWHDELGWNYRLTNLQAAVGLAQLEKLDKVIEGRRIVARKYRDAFRGTRITWAPEAPWAETVYWLVSVLVPGGREAVLDALTGQGIENRPFFYPLHSMPPFPQQGAFPAANDVGARGLNLPSSNDLTNDEIRVVVDALRAAVDKHAPREGHA